MYNYLRFPNFRLKALTLSYDDAPIFDRRLIEIMSAHGLRGTFNINSSRIPDVTDPNRRNLTPEEAVALVLESGNEIAVHGAHHLHLSGIPMVHAMRDVVDDRIALERMCGTPIRGMAYAYGAYNDAVVEMLAKAGIRYSRTTHSTEKFDLPTDWLRLPATCHHDNPRLMALCDQFLAIEDKGLWHTIPRLFYLWGHSYEFNDKNNWHVIEEFCDYMGGRESEIWYATNIEIYEYIEDFNHLIFSADGDIVKNPTARTLWFDFEGQSYSIAAGESFRISDRRDPNVKGYWV